jgi:hypothetical protein
LKSQAKLDTKAFIMMKKLFLVALCALMICQVAFAQGGGGGAGGGAGGNAGGKFHHLSFD